MTEPKFTPGPYTASIIETHSSATGEWRTSYEVCVWKDTLKTVAEVFPIDDNDNEAEATTHLLAAAPEMYDMLAFILEFVENGGNEGEIRECYAEAIAKILRKARGEM